MQHLGTKGVKACIRFLQYVLRDGQVHQGGIDIFMAEIGGQVMEACLRIDPGAIPRQHPVDDKGVPQVMEPRPQASCLRLQTRPSDDIGQQMPDGDQLVALAFVLIPEERCRGLLERGALRADMEIVTQHGDETRPERELARLEELGVLNGEGGLVEVEIAKRQADEFA